jgi:hypothetical protein
LKKYPDIRDGCLDDVFGIHGNVSKASNAKYNKSRYTLTVKTLDSEISFLEVFIITGNATEVPNCALD